MHSPFVPGLSCFRPILRGRLRPLCTALSILAAVSIPLYAQEVTVSPDLPVRDGMNVESLGRIGDNLLFFLSDGQQFRTWALDDAMYASWDREVVLGERRVDVFRSVGWTDRFHVLYGMRDRGDYKLLHKTFDPSANLIDSSSIEVIENVFLTPQVYLRLSEDKTKALLFNEEQQTLRCWSYDLVARELLWKATIVFQGRNLYRDYNTLLVTDDGNLFIAVRPTGYLERLQSFEIFYTTTSEPGVVKQQPVSLGGPSIYDYHLAYDNRNDCLVLSGLYADRNPSRAQGFFFSRMVPSQVPLVDLLPFEPDLLRDLYGRDVPPDKGVSDFAIRDVALREDGGVVLIAEMSREFARRSTMPMRRDVTGFAGSGWVDFYYEDMILQALHPDGRVHWRQVLHKKQYSQDDDARYSSYFLFRTPEQLRFLFNDEIKQENTIGGYEVTATGHLVRRTVFNTDYHRLKLRFRNGEQISYNECIIPSERSSRMNLVRIKFPD